MIFTFNFSAFAANSESRYNERISRSDIETIFSSKPAAASALSSQDEELLFQKILDELQPLWREQQNLNENGQSSTIVDARISELEEQINQLNYVTKLSEDQIQALTIGRPLVPTSNNYVNCYGVITSTSYGGKNYEVFHIYAVSKKWGGFANPLAYTGSLTLLTDNSYTNNQFLQTVEALSKFALGANYLKFAIADFLILSQHPGFFDRGTTQSLVVDYIAQQTFVFSYVSEKNSNWYDLVQTTERLGLAETFIASSTSHGVPDKASKNYNHVMQSLNYASSGNAAKIYATYGSSLQAYYVGSVTYYVGSAKKGSINTNVYREPASIPGLG